MPCPLVPARHTFGEPEESPAHEEAYRDAADGCLDQHGDVGDRERGSVVGGHWGQRDGQVDHPECRCTRKGRAPDVLRPHPYLPLVSVPGRSSTSGRMWRRRTPQRGRHCVAPSSGRRPSLRWSPSVRLMQTRAHSGATARARPQRRPGTSRLQSFGRRPRLSPRRDRPCAEPGSRRRLTRGDSRPTR